MPPSPAGRLVRQLQAIDAWHSARRMRERMLEAEGGSRVDRWQAAEQLELLRRTQDAIANCCARHFTRQTGTPLVAGPTAVVAHRHTWFTERLCLLLVARGVRVLECTGNAADALGAIVVEQPDVVVIGERLSLMTSDVLMTEVRMFAPSALCAVQTRAPDKARAGPFGADVVFRPHQPPGDIAAALVLLLASRAAKS